VRYGLATGVLVAVYTLWDGWAVKRAGVPPTRLLLGRRGGARGAHRAARAARPAEIRSLWRTQRWRVLGIALLSPLGYILILLALRQGDVGHIAPAREVSILIGAYLGGRVLGEGDRRRRLVASAAFAAGVIALALA
jgi:hypothetical protein